MAGAVTTPNSFQTQNGPIPLSQLDSNFSTIVGVLNSASTFSNYYVDSSGAANTMTVTIPLPTTFSYVAGTRLDVKIANTTTAGIVNLNVNSLGNQAVQNTDGSNLSVGQLVAGMIISLQYNGAAFLLVGAASKPASIAPFQVGAAANVSLPAPSAGVALAITGGPNLTAFQITSGAAANQSVPDAVINRAGSTANVIDTGPSIQLEDTNSTTITVIQHSGGQTEFWQYNGAWRQTQVFGAYSSGFLLSYPNAQTSGAATAGGIAVPATVAGYMVVSIAGTSRKIPYYST